MGRGATWLTLGLAVVVGLVAGALAFYRVGPFPLGPAAGPSAAQPGATTGPSTSVPSPSPRRTPSPRPSPSARPSASPEPAFTAQALLQPQEFLDRGWGRAVVTQTWVGLPPEQITSCTGMSDDDAPIRAAHAATYRGASTTAAEVVARYETTSDARVATQRLIDRITRCADAAEGEPRLEVTTMTAPDPDGITELYLWNTTGAENVEGVIGLARADDRIALLTLVSSTTDPVETTEVGSLVLQAGRRLV